MKVKERDYYFDNAKLVLIFLVVLGHFIEPLMDVNVLAKVLVLFIYSFHMPAFIFISGYFSKGKMTKGWILNIFKKFFIPYIIFQCSFILFTKLIKIEGYDFTLLYPSYACWFLFAMFVWNIVLKIIVKINLKIEFAILLNILFAILASYIDKVYGFLSISRIIIFFPFFMCGYYFKLNKIDIKTIINNKKIPVLLIILNIVFIFLFKKYINIGWLYCNTPYKYLAVKMEVAPLIRLGTYFYQTIMMFSILSIIPAKKYNITSIGANTLYVYIIHSFIVKLVLSTSFYNDINFIKILFLFILSIITVYLTGYKFISNIRYENNVSELVDKI